MLSKSHDNIYISKKEQAYMLKLTRAMKKMYSRESTDIYTATGNII